MNRINPKKLLNSKWTAALPVNRERHFIVSDVEYDEEGIVVSCELEAVLSKRCLPITWLDLKDSTCWIHGWK